MGEIETTLRYTKELESLLVTQLGASGKGLHEKTTSVEDRLPRELERKLRFIASVRNKLMHEDGYQVDNFEGFVSSCELALVSVRALAQNASDKSSPPTPEAPRKTVPPIAVFEDTSPPPSGSVTGTMLGLALLTIGIVVVWHYLSWRSKLEIIVPTSGLTGSAVKIPDKKVAQRIPQATPQAGVKSKTKEAVVPKPVIHLPAGQWGQYGMVTSNGSELMSVYSQGDRIVVAVNYFHMNSIGCYEVTTEGKKTDSATRFPLRFRKWIQVPEGVNRVAEKVAYVLSIPDSGTASLLLDGRPLQIYDATIKALPPVCLAGLTI